jgi:cold shock protein
VCRAGCLQALRPISRDPRACDRLTVPIPPFVTGGHLLESIGQHSQGMGNLAVERSVSLPAAMFRKLRVSLRLCRARHGELHCVRGVEVSVGQVTAPLCAVPYTPNGAEKPSFPIRFHCISRQPQAMEATQLWRPSMARGTVKWFNSQKGYGFIQPQAGGKDVFVHISAVEKAGLTGLNEGQTIEYEEVSNRGTTSAENLKVQR